MLYTQRIHSQDDIYKVFLYRLTLGNLYLVEGLCQNEKRRDFEKRTVFENPLKSIRLNQFYSPRPNDILWTQHFLL